MSTCRIALLGHGNVGQQVLHILTSEAQRCADRAGRPLVVTWLAVQDPARPRVLPSGAQPRVTGDPMEVIQADDVDLVVELIGGCELPRTLIRSALAAGKDVVTANKLVLAEHGDELARCAAKADRALLFEAAVAGAIPILLALEHGMPTGHIQTLTGILNGTSNHLLAALERGVPFADALREAQRLGFAEADPTLDLDGSDAAHKLCLLARLVSLSAVPLSAVTTTGILGIEPQDLAFGARHGWTMKLLARLDQRPAGTTLEVCPCWIPQDSVLAAVRDEHNAVLIEGQPFGTMMFQGKGAGGGPTAGSVVADIIRAARGERPPQPVGPPLAILDPRDEPARYHVRLGVMDRPGVLGKIATVFGERGISLAAVEQPESEAEQLATLHIVTHEHPRRELDRALDQLLADGIISDSPLRVRLVTVAGVSP